MRPGTSGGGSQKWHYQPRSGPIRAHGKPRPLARSRARSGTDRLRRRRQRGCGMSVLKKALLVVGTMTGIGCWLGASIMGFNVHPSRINVVSLMIVGFVIGAFFVSYGLSPVAWKGY